MSLPGIRRPGMCPTWTPGIQGAADRECVQLGHRGSWRAAGRKCVQLGHQGSWVLPAGNVSNLDTGDPGEPPAGNVSNLDTGDPGEPPAGNVSNLDTRDPGSRRPEMCPNWTQGIQNLLFSPSSSAQIKPSGSRNKKNRRGT